MIKSTINKKRPGVIIPLLLIILILSSLATLLTGCGDNNNGSFQQPQSQAGGTKNTMANTSTAQALAQNYLAAWEANDGAKMDKLFAQLPYGASSTQRLLDRSSRFGNPVASSGRILNLLENGGTATADVAVVLDCKNVSGCTSDLLAAQPEWAGKGRVVAADNLTLQRQADSKTWLIIAVKSSTYLQDLSESQTATARPPVVPVQRCLGSCPQEQTVEPSLTIANPNK